MSFLLAPAGDQSAHLQWRLLHGELLVQNPPRVAVLMIGTNDLGAAAECFGYNATLIASAVKKTFERCVPDNPIDSRPRTHLCAAAASSSVLALQRGRKNTALGTHSTQGRRSVAFSQAVMPTT